MDCERFRHDWTDWHEGWLEGGTAVMARHRDGCPACARYDRQMRRLIGTLAELPLPDSAPVPVRRATTSRWIALAATLVLGIALGLLLGDRTGNGDIIVAEPVAVGSGTERRIAIAVESPRAFERVEFVIELPDGVELAGFPGQRTVRWDGELAEGRSRLQLPLRVAADAGDGELVTRIIRPDGERRLVVPLDVDTGSAALDAVAV